MNWFTRLFTRTIVVDEELLELGLIKHRLEASIHDLRIDHSQLVSLNQEEYDKLGDLRDTLTALHTEQANIEAKLSFKTLNETIKNQTIANEHMARALQAAEARANDEALKRITERYYDIKTGGY
jgi:ABC-type transporter Mla subunit MlaD